MGRLRVAVIIALLLIAASCSSSSTSPAPATTDSTSSTAAPETSDAPATSAPDLSDPGTSVPNTVADPPVTGEPGGFDDHAVREIRSLDDFEALAADGPSGQSVLKFLIPDLLGNDPDLAGDVFWLDSNFFKLHDEWVFFRLVNNEPVPGFASEPLDEGEFASVEEIYEHFDGVEIDDLPGDLRWAPADRPGERLYVGEFYAQALQYNSDRDVYGNYTSRSFGMGSIIRTPPTAISGAKWLMELQFSDRVTPEEVAAYFDSLLATLPEQIGSSLEWIIRSAEQDDVAVEMAANDFAYADRVVRWSDIVPPGEVEVYNEGIAAGRLLLVEEGGEKLSDARDTDIIVMERVPDYLPPANAIITSDPQTPLAHVNLLARNRGIPNASRSGLLDDASIRRHAAARAPVVVRTSADGELDITVIRIEDYREWLNLLEQQPIRVPAAPSGAPKGVLDLTTLAETIENQAEIDALVPVIGGKAAGFLSLLAADDVAAPPEPVVITTPVYEEHLDQIRPALDAMLTLDGFDNSANARLRTLLLEGRDTFDEEYPDEPDQLYADEVLESEDPALADVVAAGGFGDYLRDAPMNTETLADITSSLEDNFGTYAVGQGLRFRSSSSVEDIEGFSGAGLYDSNTGFLDAGAQESDDQKKTIERTLKKTWASYWGFEAYEERRREQVDHDSGAMAVLVHARFDDDLEVANGVATFRINPSSGPDTGDSVATINVQKGAVSVTNPDPDDVELPEIIEVRANNGTSTITRLAESTLSPGVELLSDDQVAELHRQLESVATLWLARSNASLTAERQATTVTLDFEFKVMAEGWPQRDTGPAEPSRLIVKQARSLDPGLRAFDQGLRALPIPRDVLARARRIEEITCPASTEFHVFTTPLLAPDMGYDVTPFSTRANGPATETQSDCTQEVLFSSPDEFLAELLEK